MGIRKFSFSLIQPSVCVCVCVCVRVCVCVHTSVCVGVGGHNFANNKFLSNRTMKFCDFNSSGYIFCETFMNNLFYIYDTIPSTGPKFVGQIVLNN